MKKYGVTMLQDDQEFSFPVLARDAKSAQNKAQRYYPKAEITHVEYLGFYLRREFVSAQPWHDGVQSPKVEPDSKRLLSIMNYHNVKESKCTQKNY